MNIFSLTLISGRNSDLCLLCLFTYLYHKSIYPSVTLSRLSRRTDFDEYLDINSTLECTLGRKNKSQVDEKWVNYEIYETSKIYVSTEIPLATALVKLLAKESILWRKNLKLTNAVPSSISPVGDTASVLILTIRPSVVSMPDT